MNFITCLFTSTKGHFGYKDLYKKTVTDLLNKSTIIAQHPKLAHIKVSPGEESISNEMRDWLEDKKFTVITTSNEWHHNDPSHHAGYLADVNKMWSAARHYEFGLWLEDDFLFNTSDLDAKVETAIKVMSFNRDILHYRWTRVDQFDNLERTVASPYSEWHNHFHNRNEFSFNPCFVRPTVQNLVARFCAINHRYIHPHCEMAYTLSNLMFSNIDKPFVFCDNHIVEHIGTKEYIDAIK